MAAAAGAPQISSLGLREVVCALVGSKVVCALGRIDHE
jgi:hypothetical protein